MCAVKRLTPEERREEIMEAAAKIFTDKGFSNTTMEDVIAGTSMSKGGVYHYYKSTVDILHDLMVNGIRYRNDIIKSYMNDYQEGFEIEFMAKRFVEKMIDDNPYMEIYVQFLLEKKRNEKLSQLFEELKEESRVELSKIVNHGLDFLLHQKCYDFVTNFLNAMIIGADVLEARENFKDNKAVLEKMVALLLREKYR